MNFFTPNSEPLFLENAGIGYNFGLIAPQIKYFDVFYTLPPVVGLQILGSDEE